MHRFFNNIHHPIPISQFFLNQVQTAGGTQALGFINIPDLISPLTSVAVIINNHLGFIIDDKVKPMDPVFNELLKDSFQN
ncbi:hypothetical protein D3C85_1801250 [compost metagenome]